MKCERIAERWKVTPEHLAAIDSAIAAATPDVDSLTPWYNAYGAGQRRRLSFDLDHVRRFASRDDVIVEFGAVPPILTIALTRLGYSVCGLDLAPARFQSAIHKENLNVKEVNFEVAPLPFADDAVDVIIFNEVFEHLRIDPIFTFSEVNRVLKMQGTLLLSTPNLKSWRGWYFFVVKDCVTRDVYENYRKISTLGHMGHVRLYSPREVATFLAKMGFTPQLVVHRGQWESPSKRVRAVGNLALKMWPRLRPSFSIVAKKTTNASASATASAGK